MKKLTFPFARANVTPTAIAPVVPRDMSRMPRPYLIFPFIRPGLLPMCAASAARTVRACWPRAHVGAALTVWPPL